MKIFLILFLISTTISFAQTNHIIEVRNFAFVPQYIEIALGDTVEWKWIEGVHTTTSDSVTGENSWDEVISVLAPGFKKVLTTIGIHNYYCIFHADVGMIGAITVTDPLPVELNSVSAKAYEKNIILKWTTATETNNHGFEVQRSSGQVKESSGVEEWEKIGFIQGAGNSTVLRHYSFVDDKIYSSGIYNYRLKQIDFDGTYKYSSFQSVQFNLTNRFNLEQNFPNPFNPVTTISFQIPEDGNTTLKIYNAIGKEVSTLLNEYKTAGKYEIAVDISNIADELPSGVYYYILRSNGFFLSRKMTVVK